MWTILEQQLAIHEILNHKTVFFVYVDNLSTRHVTHSPLEPAEHDSDEEDDGPEDREGDESHPKYPHFHFGHSALQTTLASGKALINSSLTTLKLSLIGYS